MVACTACGETLKSGRGLAIGIDGKTYHAACAPDKLVVDSLEEWNAIVRKGVQYFVGKYLPEETRPAKYQALESRADAPARYISLFSEAGASLRAEDKKRQRKRKA